MAFSTIMVHVDGEQSASRVRLAAELAGRFSATLIGISACILPPYRGEGAYFVSGEFARQEQRDVMAALERMEASFLADAAPQATKLEWRSERELPEKFVSAEARAADLVVLGRAPKPMDICRFLDPGAVALRTGRPVLVVPPEVETLKAERIVVGWKDCREARRALQDSLALMREAKSVSVIEAYEDDSEASARRRVDDVARYLTRHCVSVRSVRAMPAKSRIAENIVEFAGVEGADLIVAGAYGRSRFDEWAFGGVTRDLLASSSVCCFVSN
jgi:nucleotide-binding universal stress UspA family protein